jgi:Membrane protein involved in the export of O-antigen and teichoic acid
MENKNIISKRKINFDRILPVILSAFAAIFSMLTSLLIAKPLGNELYGIIQYYLGIITTASTIIGFGIGFILIKSSQFQDNPKSFFTKYLILFDIISAVGLPIFYLISFFLLANIDENVLLIFMLYGGAYCTAYDGLLGSYLLGTKKATISTAVTSFFPKLALFVSSLLILKINGSQKLVDYYVPVYFVVYFLACVPYSWFLIKRTKFKFEKKELLSVFSFFVLVATQSLNASLSKVIQGQYDAFQSENGKSYTGILGLSFQIMSLATLFATTIVTLAQPIFAEVNATGDKRKLIEQYRTVLRVNSYISIPFCVALMVEVKTVLGIFGETYSGFENIIFFLLISASTLLSSVCGPCGTLLTFSGHEKIQIFNGLAYIGIFVLFGIILKTVTIYGIPIAYLFATVVVEAAKMIELGVFYKTLPIDLKSIITILSIGILSSCIFYGLSFVQNFYLWAIGNIVVGMAFILLCLLITPFKQDKLFFSKRGSAPESPLASTENKDTNK